MNRPASLPIEFDVTPRFEAFYALYTLTNTAPSSLDPWKERALMRLPRDFDRVAKRVAPVPLFWPLLADALQGTPGEMTFEEVLAAVRDMPPDELKANVLSGIFHDAATVQSLVSGKKTLRQILTSDKLRGAELLTHFGLRPYFAHSDAVSAMGRLVSDPESFREELALVLQRFWQTGFKRDWSALEPVLRAESFHMKDLHENESLGELIIELNLPITVDEKAGELRQKSGAVIKYDRIDRLSVIPSSFNTHRWWAKYETRPQRFSLYFPVKRDAASPNRLVEQDREVQEPSRPSRSALNPESVFRALGDTTRYAIASVLARTPTTSAELARSLRVSKPTITHHVQALRAAGLIDEEPGGGSNRLSLNRDTVAALSKAAVEQLFSSTGDLALVTTRKRRDS
ncbi:MAG TPA: winged helix-turn-helix domain-containing protein [Gemmatimonadaceae bacterium]|nr:winged helix-turn-helix domain-containing protein [Gemmatimonadaceae bacterium]